MLISDLSGRYSVYCKNFQNLHRFELDGELVALVKLSGAVKKYQKIPWHQLANPYLFRILKNLAHHAPSSNRTFVDCNRIESILSESPSNISTPLQPFSTFSRSSVLVPTNIPTITITHSPCVYVTKKLCILYLGSRYSFDAKKFCPDARKSLPWYQEVLPRYREVLPWRL